MPPVVLLALLACHCAAQVCMRCICGFSLANLGSTAIGKTAFPVITGAEGGAAAMVGAGFGWASAAGGGAAGAAAGVAASAAHSDLRKSFHFWPLSVPAVLAA